MPMLDVARRSAGLLRRLQSRYLPTRLDRIKAVHGWTREVQLRYLIRQVRALPDRADWMTGAGKSWTSFAR